jgi:excisionase family DNA binding protein
MSVGLVSVREAAEQTGQSEKQIRAMIRDGRLRVVRVGYHVLLRKTELRKLIPAGTEN